MRTSLNELQTAEAFLADALSPNEKLVFEARLLGEPGLREELDAQQETYALIKTYSRETLRREIANVRHSLFTLPQFEKFRARVRRFFPDC